MKLTSFRLPSELHDRVKLYCKKEGMTMQGFMKNAIELYLMKLKMRPSLLDGQICLCGKSPCSCQK